MTYDLPSPEVVEADSVWVTLSLGESGPGEGCFLEAAAREGGNRAYPLPFGPRLVL